MSVIDKKLENELRIILPDKKYGKCVTWNCYQYVKKTTTTVQIKSIVNNAL